MTKWASILWNHLTYKLLRDLWLQQNAKLQVSFILPKKDILISIYIKYSGDKRGRLKYIDKQNKKEDGIYHFKNWTTSSCKRRNL